MRYWLEEAYSDRIADTDALRRSLAHSTNLPGLLFASTARFPAFAGEYGILTGPMRNAGLDFRWSDRYCENMFAQEALESIEGNEAFDTVTALEVTETFTAWAS